MAGVSLHMADPKYAHLPGIAHGQPDCYETSELPEDEQLTVKEEFESEAIEKTEIQAAVAFAKFKGKGLDASKIDFSDRIGLYKRTGYGTDWTEYEMESDGNREKETRQQRYQRLQHEIRELLDECDKEENAQTEADRAAVDGGNLASCVENLRGKLADAHVRCIVGSGSVDGQPGSSQKQLLSRLKQLNATSARSGEAGKKTEKPRKDVTADGADQVNYELFYKPEQAKFSQAAEVAKLENRLKNLEMLVGKQPANLSSMTAGGGAADGSLQASLARLLQQMTLIDPKQLEGVDARLQAVNTRLNQLAEKKQAIDDVDKNNKISELFELVKKWDKTCATLPDTKARLVALKDIHQQALQFSQALSQVDTKQQQLTASVETNRSMLDNVATQMADNVKILHTNLQSLASRVEKL